MTTTTMHPLAEDYLDGLEHAARRLPRGQRRELVEEISAHLAEATDPTMSDAEVMTVLDRLGDPEDIVEAEQPTETVRRRGTHEGAAIFLLLFGGFIFVFGWIAGAIMLWSSRAWDTRDKLIGTLVVPGGLATVVLAGLLGATTQVCTSGPGHPTTCSPGPSTLHNIASIAVLAFCFFGPIFTAIYLARRAR
jgi:hypothetical protein